MSLLEQLNVFLDARIDATSTGNQITSTSANGHSVTFAAPAADFSQQDLAETSDRLLTLYELVVAGGTTGDASIYAAMLLRLRAARSVRADFTLLRRYE